MEVTNRIVAIKGEEVIITESIKTTINKKQLEDTIRQLETKKIRLQEQNERILVEYNLIDAELKETTNLLSQFNNEVISLEVISKDV